MEEPGSINDEKCRLNPPPFERSEKNVSRSCGKTVFKPIKTMILEKDFNGLSNQFMTV